MSIEHNQTFVIDSRRRLNGTDSNFSYVIDIDRTDPLSRVYVKSVSIPKSYYLCDTGYNTFTLEENSVQTTITVPPGNYNRRALATVLPTLLNAGSVACGHTYTYLCTYSNVNSEADTGKLYFSVSGNSGVQPKFIFTTNDVYEMLGFNLNSTNTFSANALTSTNVIKLVNEDCIMIRSDIQDAAEGDILQPVLSTGNPSYSTIVEQYTRESSKKFRRDNSAVYNFRITNENGRVLNLNGINVIIEICIYHEYENNMTNILQQIYDLSKKYFAFKGMN